jgi:hypothetical protein
MSLLTTLKTKENPMDIFLAVNQTTGYMEMIFDNYEDAKAWTDSQTAKTGDLYDLEEEEAC